MREFFRGWRRKLGCVALVMALAVMGIWMRSRQINDRLFLNQASSRIQYSIDTVREGYCFERCNLSEGTTFIRDRRWISSVWDDNTASGRYSEVHWNWNAFGFATGDFVLLGNSAAVFESNYLIIPHWICTSPLTLLSAYLLLWKPRPKPKGESNA